VSAGALVPLETVRAMLDECAPGHTATRKTHHFWVTYQGKTFQRLPLGEHGARRPEVYIGHVRAMVRLFGIRECARRFIPAV
jgi:hypothetical protein